MSGIRIKLPVNFTDTTLPVLADDPVLTNGSLALVELADLPGVPAAGSSTLLPNIAASRVRPLLPVGVTDAQVRPTLQVSATLAPTHGKLERTSRGGLHAAFTQTNGVAQQGAQLRLPTAIREFMAANPSHKFGLWVWLKTTRATLGQHQRISFGRAFISGAANDFGANINQSTILMLNYGTTSAWFAPGPDSAYYTLTAGSNTVGTTARTYAAVKGGWSATAGQAGGASNPPATAADLVATINMGTVGGAGNGGGTLLNSAPSTVLYRMYLEDLTVSGRTPEAVNALDQAAFNAAFGAGGRYHGDTHTAPATLVP